MNMTSHYSTTIKKLSHYSKTEQIQTATIDILLLYYQEIILLWKKVARSLCYTTVGIASLTSQSFEEKTRSSSLNSFFYQPVYTQVCAS